MPLTATPIMRLVGINTGTQKHRDNEGSAVTTQSGIDATAE
jgi:hypothetical protein